MAFRAGDNVIYEHTDLIAKTLVIFLVAATEYHLKRCLQRRDHLWMNGKLVDSLLAANFDQIPESFNRKRNDV